MVVVFAGAGASCAVSSENYPTTIDFFERLPSGISKDALFSLISEHVRSGKEDGIIDIEDVLWALGSVKATYGELSNSNSASGYLFHNNRIKKIGQFSYDMDDSLRGIKNILTSTDRLIGEINKQVFDLYGSLPERSELSSNWSPLLSGLAETGEQVEIFTTNYDQIIESAIELENLPYCSGPQGSTRPTIDHSKWSRGLEDGQIGRLTKLHGSIDWNRGNGVIHTGTPTYKGDLNEHVMLFPGFKGEPTLEPYSTFHEHFASACQKAKCILFIGFAFRDEYINQVIAQNLSERALVVTINPSKVECDFLESHAYKDELAMGFDYQAVGHALDLVIKSAKTEI